MATLTHSSESFLPVRCFPFRTNASAAVFHGRARGRLPLTPRRLVSVVERRPARTFARCSACENTRMETFVENGTTLYPPRRLTISPWDRASVKRPAAIELGLSVNEKTFRPENNSRIDTHTCPVDPVSYRKKDQARPHSSIASSSSSLSLSLSLPLSLRYSVIVNGVTRGTRTVKCENGRWNKINTGTVQV